MVYLYFYSLVTMNITRRQLTNVAKPEGTHTPMNTFASLSASMLSSHSSVRSTPRFSSMSLFTIEPLLHPHRLSVFLARFRQELTLVPERFSKAGDKVVLWPVRHTSCSRRSTSQDRRLSSQLTEGALLAK